jgi:hypothetical protein
VSEANPWTVIGDVTRISFALEARSQNGTTRFLYANMKSSPNDLSMYVAAKEFWLLARDFWLPYPAVFWRDIEGEALA